MSKEIIPSPGGSNKFSRLISKIKAALGIVEESNTATHSIAAGKYVTWKGDLYKAKSAISSGATLSSSNLQTVPEGGLNELSEQIGTLNSKIVNFGCYSASSGSEFRNTLYPSLPNASLFMCKHATGGCWVGYKQNNNHGACLYISTNNLENLNLYDGVWTTTTYTGTTG